jgi:hypothetical protein
MGGCALKFGGMGNVIGCAPRLWGEVEVSFLNGIAPKENSFLSFVGRVLLVSVSIGEMTREEFL